MLNLNVGDRVRHFSGSVWLVKEKHPNSVMLGIGAFDFVAVSWDELCGYEGAIPFAVMRFRKV